MKLSESLLVLALLCSLSSCSGIVQPPTPQTGATPLTEPAPTEMAVDTPGAESSTDHPALPESGVIVLRGSFDPSGETLLEFGPARWYAYQSEPIPNQPAGRFLAVVTYASGEVTTVPFDALISDDAGRTYHGFFEITIPVSGTIASLEITDASGGKVFAHVAGSEILP